MRDLPILQIEDDENDVFLLEHAFKKAGIQQPLRAVRDGQEGVDYLSGEGEFSDRRRFPLPCLIILDLKMPRKNGIEFIEWLRGEPRFRRVPVLMLSSSANPDDIDRAYEAGANAFLVKPASNPERLRLAAALKEFWLEFNHPPTSCSDEYLRADNSSG